MIYLAIITLIVSYISARVSISDYMTLMTYRYGRIKSFRYSALIKPWAYYAGMFGLNMFTFPIIIFIYYLLSFLMKESLGFIPPIVAVSFLCLSNYFYGPRFYLAGYFNDLADQLAKLMLLQEQVVYRSFSGKIAGFYESIDEKKFIKKGFKEKTYKDQGDRNDSESGKLHVPFIRTGRNDERIH